METNEETKIKNKMISGGMNPKDADVLVKKHYTYLNRVYEDYSIKQKAEIAMTLGK